MAYREYKLVEQSKKKNNHEAYEEGGYRSGRGEGAGVLNGPSTYSRKGGGKGRGQGPGIDGQWAQFKKALWGNTWQLLLIQLTTRQRQRPIGKGELMGHVLKRDAV